MGVLKSEYLDPSARASWKTLSSSLSGFPIAASLSHVILNFLRKSSSLDELFFREYGLSFSHASCTSEL